MQQRSKKWWVVSPGGLEPHVPVDDMKVIVTTVEWVSTENVLGHWEAVTAEGPAVARTKGYTQGSQGQSVMKEFWWERINQIDGRRKLKRQISQESVDPFIGL